MNRRGLLKMAAAAPAAAALRKGEPMPVSSPVPTPVSVADVDRALTEMVNLRALHRVGAVRQQYYDEAMTAKSAYVDMLIRNNWISVESAREVLGLDG